MGQRDEADPGGRSAGPARPYSDTLEAAGPAALAEGGSRMRFAHVRRSAANVHPIGFDRNGTD